MASLTEVWPQLVRLLKSGVNLIPVRDKDDDRGKKKVAFAEWKQYMTQMNTEANLFRELETHKTEAVAMVCGVVSGNLEIIDIDVKYRPGIDAQLFSDIKSLYPELFEKLRLHKTPSGGFHILYRISDHAPDGNKKLSSRPATEDELIKAPKTKNYCFLETRGEGGYALTPPSLGYLVFRDVPIPVITWEERCSLIQVASMYNEIVKVEKPIEKTKAESSYYSENPFEHFNNTCNAIELLESYGWAYVKSNATYDMFTRPGGSKGNIHAGFNKEKRFFKVFTSNTPLEGDAAYLLSTVMAVHEFNGDKKQAYQKLVNLGFGKIRPQQEARLIARGGELPANMSDEGRVKAGEHMKKMADTYPHGTFWDFDEHMNCTINREGLYSVAAGIGFRWYEKKLYRIQGIFVHRVLDMRLFYDTLKAYIREEDGDLYVAICNAFEAYIERHGEFSASRVQALDDAEIVKDTINTSYKFFQNGYMYINAQSAKFQGYASLIGLVMHEDVQDRQFTKPEGKIAESKYYKFLEYAVRVDVKKDYLMPIIGYLAHRYKDETMAYIIVLTEEVQHAEEGGGSGKNVFCSLLSNTTTYKNIPASQSRLDERFLQPWNGERVLCLSDLPRNFDFLFLKELASGDGLLKKLFKDQETIPVWKMPKLITQTNYSYDNVDGGLKRRIIPIEFTNYFTVSGGVDGVFGCHFPKGWTMEDWACYDLFMAHCLQSWLKQMKLRPNGLSETGWTKQFELTHGANTLQFIQDNIDNWQKRGVIASSDFSKQYEDFCRENTIEGRYKKSNVMLTQALTTYCKKMGIGFQNNVTRREGPTVQKVKVFELLTNTDAGTNDEELPF